MPRLKEKNAQKRAEELEKRQSKIRKLREKNIRWTVSENYEKDQGQAYSVFFKSMRPEKPENREPSYYKNAVLGELSKRFETEKIMGYASYLWENLPDGDLFSQLLSVPLEEAAYKSMAEERPAIISLRKSYMRKKLYGYNQLSPNSWLEFLDYAHAQRALGQVPKVNGMGKKLLDDLEALSEKDTEDFILGMQDIIRRHFHLDPAKISEEELNLKIEEVEKKVKKPKEKYLSDEELLKEITVGSAEFMDNILLDDSKKVNQEDPAKIRFKKRKIKNNRAFMEKNFGPSILNKGEEEALKAEVSRGYHADQSFLITEGFPDLNKNFDLDTLDWSNSPYKADQMVKDLPYRQKLVLKALSRNTTYVHDNYRSIHRAINILADKLKSALKNEEENGIFLEDHGRLATNRAWRNPVLDDDKVFYQVNNDLPEKLLVDLVLDSSGSQRDRQAEVAAQGYILSQALEKAKIPFRVSSFQTLLGCTVIHQFHDYFDRSSSANILSYFADSANRDGYALRLVKARMKRKSPYKNVMIVLSDGKPFYVQVGVNTQASLFQSQTENEKAIRDTANEVRQIRAENIAVFGLFTGVEEDLPAGQKIYGSGFAYIKNPDRFAEIVAQILLNQIRNIN